MSRRSLLLIPLIAAVIALVVPTSAPAQDEKKVTLRWFGQSYFQLEVGNQLIVIDPNAIPQFGRPVVDANVVLISHNHVDHNQILALKNPKAPRIEYAVKGDGKKSEWAKFDEKISGTRIRTLGGTFHDTTHGMRLGKNGIWIIEANGIVFCHLGDLGHELTDDQVKAIGPVDVLMVPVGGVYTINGEIAKKVVSHIKPKLYVLPMHYGVPGFDDLAGPDEFLDGQKNVKKMPDTNELVITAGMKQPDAPTIVVLGWEKKEPPKKK